MTISKSEPPKPSFLIEITGNASFKENILKFLKFSTHAKYLYSDKSISEIVDDSPYWILSEKSLIKTCNKIIIEKNRIKLINSCNKSNIIGVDNSTGEILFKKFKSFFHDFYLKNQQQKITLRIDFLIDFEGDAVMLGIKGCQKKNELFLASDLKQKFPNVCLKIKTNGILNNRFIQLEVSVDNHGVFLIRTNKHETIDFDLYGLSGVNIPLISIMNFLNYKISTVRMVEKKHFFTELVLKKYKIQYNYIYVDLDQTLIWYWFDKKVKLVNEFIFNQKEKGKKIILITRHEKNIQNTLKTVGIDINIFQQIISVKPYELKSSYINEKEAIFIDDEFNQRLDVKNQCFISVFDLFQLQYLA